MNEPVVTRVRRIEIATLVALLAGCGGSSTVRPDGGNAGSGGSPGTGGAIGTGGTTGSGGTPGTGGATGSGGVSGTGGASGTGGTTTVPSGSAGATGVTGTGGATVPSGSGGATGSGGAPGSGGAGGSAGRDGGATCNCGNFASERSCCGDRCLNLHNDPLNCGACGNKCPTDKPLCDNSVCRSIPCGDGAFPAPVCAGGTCCGRNCCQPNQVCCNIRGPVDILACHTPTAEQPNCPLGCYPLCMSDRNLKRAVELVDPQEVLTKVRQLPITTWQYLSDPENVRHMGPMAQDFKQAFGLGDTDRAYHPIDAHGVALASIQALAKLAAEQKRHVELLQRKNVALERRLKALERK